MFHKKLRRCPAGLQGIYLCGRPLKEPLGRTGGGEMGVHNPAFKEAQHVAAQD